MTQSVLIVDADQSFTDSAQVALEERGVVVHVRDDAPLDLIKKLKPTVLMLNIELPKGATTGLSICSRIRRDRDLRATPILLTTTGASADMLKKHAQSADKADDYARKPITVDDVVARIDKLLQSAPESKNGEAHLEARTDDVEEQDDAEPFEDRTDVKRAERSENTPIPPPPAASREKTTTAPPPVPPPIKREITISPTTTADELWRLVRVEDVLRGALEGGEPQAPAKATPEERLAYMRQLVKYYETRDKVFREAWGNTQGLGQDLAKRTVSMAIELDRRDKRIEELALDRDNTQRRLLSVETEFKAFQDEITRIFRDKDTEEQGTYGRMTELDANNARLTKELDAAQEQNRDHERRLQIFQDEVEALQVEKDDAEAKVIELTSSLDDAHADVESLTARLETTDGVAAERADEIEKLREQVDRIALDAGQERQRLVQSYEETSAEKDAEHKVGLETLEQDQRSEIASLIKRHEELLQTLTRTQESEVESLESERSQLNQRIEDLLRGTRELEGQLRETQSSHASELGQLRAEIDEFERKQFMLNGDLETTTTLYSTVVEERDALVKESAKAQSDLATALKRVGEQDNSLDELEAALEKEKKDLGERIAELEEELDASQTESFERLAELEKLKKTHDKVGTKAQNLETSLKISEKALGVAETRGKALDSENAVLKARDDELSRQNAELEAQLKRIESLNQENVTMLERERERFARAEDLLIKAKDRIGELQKESDGSGTRLLELEEANSKKEAELSEVYAAITDAERKIEELTRAHADERTKLTRAHDEERTKSARAHEEEVSKLRPDAEASRKRISELERDLKSLEATESALLKEIDVREEKIASVEAELAMSRTDAAGFERELENERVRAHGFSQLSTQREEMMRRMVAALGAGLDVLNRPRSTDDLIREVMAEVTSALPAEDMPFSPSPVPVPVPVPVPAQVAPPAPAQRPSSSPAKKTLPQFAPPTKPQPQPQPLPQQPQPQPQPQPLQQPQKPVTSKKGPPPLPKKDAQKPFAALVQEAVKKEDKPGFDESFAEESTTSDNPQMRRFDKVDGKDPSKKKGQKKPAHFDQLEEQELEHLTNLLTESDEETDRHVTEIVRIDKLK